MQATHFIESEYYNRPCEFRFRNQTKRDGVISLHLCDHPKTLFFLPVENMKEFYVCKSIGDVLHMRTLLEEVNVEDIIEVKVLETQEAGAVLKFS